MKKRILMLGLFFGFGVLQAQEQGTISIFANAGYTLEETVPYDFADLRIKDGLQWGGGLEFYLSRTNSVELKYNRMDTQFSISPFVGGAPEYVEKNGSISSVMLGYNSYFINAEGAKSIPFIGASLGVGILDASNVSAETGFAWDIRAGVKMKTGGPISLKLQAYLQSMLTTHGTDYWAYWGYVYAVPDYQRVLQFGFGAVINYDFKASH